MTKILGKTSRTSIPPLLQSPLQLHPGLCFSVERLRQFVRSLHFSSKTLLQLLYSTLVLRLFNSKRVQLLFELSQTKFTFLMRRISPKPIITLLSLTCQIERDS